MPPWSGFSIEGKWHLLLAHDADKNLSEQPEYDNSVVTISDEQLQWNAADGKPLLSAACTWTQVGSPKWHVDLTPDGAAENRVAGEAVIPGDPGPL